MNATFLDEGGKPQLMQMGCYGIGITRLPAAAIEQNNDERGIIWPDAIAPFTVVICPIGMDRSADVKAAAQQLHDDLLGAGIDVMLDDRGERPGAMFADWELIGVPHRVVISDRGLKEGQLEYQHRRDAQATKVAYGGDRRFRQGTAHGVIGRRGCLQAAPAALLLPWLPRPAFAGAQVEEPLADSVRTALHSAIASSAPPIPDFQDIEARLAYLRWLGSMSGRLRRRTPEWQDRKEFLQTVWYESRRAGSSRRWCSGWSRSRAISASSP